MCIAITGNPVDGFLFHSPFTDSDFAVDWAEVYIIGSDWWISEVLSLCP